MMRAMKLIGRVTSPRTLRPGGELFAIQS